MNTHNERDAGAFGLVVRELVDLVDEELILGETLHRLHHQIGYLESADQVMILGPLKQRKSI